MGIKVGLQGYTVREYMRFDPLGALRKTAGIGYRYIELPNYDASGSAYYGLSAEEWKKEADAANISIIGGYVTNLTEENLEKTCAFFQKLGCSRLVIPIDYFPSRKILDEKCRFYNKAGNLCQKYGLSLYYENHYHEFQQMDGQTVMSLLLSQTCLLYTSRKSAGTAVPPSPLSPHSDAPPSRNPHPRPWPLHIPY